MSLFYILSQTEIVFSHLQSIALGCIYLFQWACHCSKHQENSVFSIAYNWAFTLILSSSKLSNLFHFIAVFSFGKSQIKRPGSNQENMGITGLKNIFICQKFCNLQSNVTQHMSCGEAVFLSICLIFFDASQVIIALKPVLIKNIYNCVGTNYCF